MPIDPISPGSGGSGASDVGRDLAGPGDIPSRSDSGTFAEVAETAEMVQNSWDQDVLDQAADIAEERRGFGTDNERMENQELLEGVNSHGTAQEAWRDQQVATAEEMVDDYRDARSEAAAAERDAKEAEMAEAHARGEAYFWGETTYDGETVEEWILPDGTVLFVDGDQVVSVDYPDGVGPLFLGETAYRGEMVGVYEMPSGSVVLVDENGNALGELGDVELDTFTIPVPGGYAEVYVVPSGPPDYTTLTYDAETGEQYYGYDTGRDASLGDKLAHDLELTEGASIYQPLGTDYAYVIDADGNIVDVYTVPPELEWSLFGIVEYYDDGTVSVDLGVIEVDVDLVGPEKGISVSVDLLIAEGTAGISWDDEGNWEFTVEADVDLGFAEAGGSLSTGMEDGNFFIEGEVYGAIMVGPLTVDGNIGAAFVQTDDGWGASVTAGAGASMGGARAGAQATYTVVHDGDGVTKTFELAAIVEMEGLGSMEVTGQFQQEVDGDGNTTNSTSAKGVVRDKHGNEVASAGELEDDNWPEDDEELPTGPGTAAAGAGFDLERDDESDGSGGSEGSDRAGPARGVVGAVGEREDGPARPGVAAAADRGVGPRGDGVYVQETASGAAASVASVAGATGPAAAAQRAGWHPDAADGDAESGPRPGGARPQPDGLRPEGPGVVFEPNDNPRAAGPLVGRRDRQPDATPDEAGGDTSDGSGAGRRGDGTRVGQQASESADGAGGGSKPAVPPIFTDRDGGTDPKPPDPEPDPNAPKPPIFTDRDGGTDPKPPDPEPDPNRKLPEINRERLKDDDEPGDDDERPGTGGRPGGQDDPFGGPESLPTQTPRTSAATTADRQVDLDSPTSVDRGGDGRPLGGERPGFDFSSTAGGSPNIRTERPDGLPPTDTTLEGEVSFDDPAPARTVDDVTSLPPTDTTLEREVSFDSPTAAGGRPGNLVEGRAGLPDDIADIPRGPATRPGAGQDVADPVTGVRADGGVHVRDDDGRPPSGEPPSDQPPSDGSDPDRPPAETLPSPSPSPERFDDIVGVGASSPSASARAGREDRARDDAGHDRGPVVDVGPDESQPADPQLADPQPAAMTEYVDLGTVEVEVDVEVASPSMVELEIEERPDPDARFGGRFEADLDDGPAFLDGPDAEPMN